MPGLRRDRINDCIGSSAPDHAHWGLWLDRYLNSEDSQDHGPHIRSIVDRPAPNGYDEAFNRWRDSWGADVERLLLHAVVQGRMVVGLGAKGSLEAGIHLDHTWGVPKIPGSALKGVAAAAAHQLTSDLTWKKRSQDSRAADKNVSDFDILFGTTDEQGAVRFHDAWWIPDQNVRPLQLDVMTVHHPKYYQAGGSNVAPPSDTDSPTPLPFASVQGRFLIVIEGGNADWREAAADFLYLGLSHLGIGAKTNSGYGRATLSYPDGGLFMLSSMRQAAVAAEQAAAEQRVAGERRKLLTKAQSADKGAFNARNAREMLTSLEMLFPDAESAERMAVARAYVKALGREWLAARAGEMAELAQMWLALSSVGEDSSTVGPPATPPSAEAAPIDERLASVRAAAGSRDALRKLTDEAAKGAWTKPQLKALHDAVRKALPKPAEQKSNQKDWIKQLEVLLKAAPES